MRQARQIALALLVGGALAVSGMLATAADLSAQGASRIQVLVAPLSTGPDVNDKFGEKVSKEVTKAIEEISGLDPMPEGDVKKALKQFNLDAAQMNPIQWRQLASRLEAQMLMVGSAERAGQGIQVSVTFLDPKSGDELPVEPFTVSDDGQDKQAASRITAGLEEQIAYQRSLIYCQEYLGSGQIEDALRNCEQALEVNPSSTRAHYVIGRVHMEAEDYPSAVEHLERVVEDNPANTEALQSLAYSHAQLGNKERSLELYQAYLEFQPDDAQVRLNIAFELAQAGAFQEASEILQAGVRRDSTNAGLWEYLGNVALAAGTATNAGLEGATVKDTAQVRLAVRAFDKVLELKGDSVGASVLTNAIAAHLEMGDLDEALAFSDRALEALRSGVGTAATGEGEVTEGTTPETPETPEGVPGGAESRQQLRARIHSLRADIFARRDNFDRALAELDEVLSIDPEYGGAYMKRGFYRLRSGNTEGALADYRKAVNEQGRDPNAIANQLFGIGYNDYFEKGQFSTAIDMFRTALEFAQDPQLEQQVNFFAAYGYYRMGTNIDQRNEGQEACQPARQALSAFQNVGPYLGSAGGYQSNSQAQIREAVDVQIYRQQQIIRARCG